MPKITTNEIIGSETFEQLPVGTLFMTTNQPEIFLKGEHYPSTFLTATCLNTGRVSIPSNNLPVRRFKPGQSVTLEQE